MHQALIPAGFLLLTSLTATAQTAFDQSKFLTDPPIQFTQFTTADFDNDGDMDFVLIGSPFIDGTFTYYIENLQDGNFAAARSVPGSEMGAYHIAAADIDGDGLIDIVWSSGGSLWWQRNAGEAQFQSPLIIADYGSSGNTLDVADLDNNNTTDIVVGFFESGQIACFLNTGGGIFGSPVIINSPGQTVMDLHTADIDSDGLVDFVTASIDNSDVSWYRNLGEGVFGPPQLLTSALLSPLSVDTADMDNDGDLDIVANSYGGILCWFENLGNGNFSTIKNISITNLGGGYMATGDFNEDGYPDVAASGPEPSEVRIFHNNGNNTFSPQGALDAAVLICRQLAVADVDMNGNESLISLSINDSRLSTYSSSTSGLGSQVPVTNTMPGANAVYSGDVDGDGLIDVVATSAGDKKVSLYSGMAPGSYAPGVVIHTAGQPISGVKLADVNGDGLPEIFFLSGPGNFVGYLPNLGGNVFGAFLQVDNGLNGPQVLQLADVNGDNELDLGVSSLGNASVYWYAGNGAGGFGTRITIINDCYGCRDFAFADLDNSGSIDLVAGGSNITKIVRNLGSGLFSFPQDVITNVQGGVSIAVFDFNGDGLPEIFTGGNFANRVKYVLNLGNMNFAAAVDVPRATVSQQDMLGCDVDQDGDIDLVVTATSENKIYWIENQSGVWGPRHILTQGYEKPSNLHAANLNGDEYPDVVAGLMNHAVWFPNKLAPCKDDYAPAGLSVQVNPTNVVVGWTPISKTIGCQVKGRKVGTSQNLTQDVPGFEVSSLTVLQSALAGGGQYEWRVRCACSLSPLSVTPWSAWSVFSIPSGNVAAENAITLFPNPVKETAQIVFSEGQPESVRVEVYDLHGRMVFSENNASQSLDLSSLSRGFYLLRTYSNTGVQTAKFLKE